jgi:flagellar basal-body rod protein FlgF
MTLKGLYTAAAGMLAEQMHTDTVADNLANVNTVAFKRRAVAMQAFPEMMIRETNRLDPTMAGKASGEVIGTLNSGASVYETRIQFDQGTLIQTSAPLDIALEGEGFFSVTSQPGVGVAPQEKDIFYTRAGHLTIDSEGYLANTEGLRVLDDNKRAIPVGPLLGQTNPSQNITITQKGEVFVDRQLAGTIRLTRFQDNRMLEKRGENLLQPVAGALEEPVATGKPLNVVQGSLETSNTNMIYEMMQNIIGLRYYESMQRNIGTQNETLGQLINQAGKLK